ncbi:MAG: DUF4129 domain-containing protein [Thermoplasmata archaeon]|nr:DUF4129 domain-containing protein [Thermoplasmata archaeon]
MSAVRRSPRASSLSWVLILGIALAVGGAAALLTASATTPTSSSTPSPTLLELSETAFQWILVAGFLGVAGFLIVDRLRQRTMPYPARILAVVLTTIVLLTVFAVVGRGLGGGSLLPLSPVGPGSNDTSGGGNTSSAANGTGSGTGFAPLHLAIPPWALFALVAAVALVGTAVALRMLGTRERTRAVRPIPTDEEVRDVLVQASAALDTDEEPRTVLVRLYGHLLNRLTPIVGDTDRQTAEEIRRGHLIRLGIGLDTAQEITHLFEEARYSQHPIGPEEVARAKSALRRAVEELGAKEAQRA